MGKLVTLDFLRNDLFRADPFHGTVFPKNAENLLHNIFSLNLLIQWCYASIFVFEPHIKDYGYTSYSASRILINFVPSWLNVGATVIIEDGLFAGRFHSWLTAKEKAGESALHYIIDVHPLAGCYPSLYPRLMSNSNNIKQLFICPPFESKKDNPAIEKLYAEKTEAKDCSEYIATTILNIIDELEYSPDNCMLEADKMTAFVEEIQRRMQSMRNEKKQQG